MNTWTVLVLSLPTENTTARMRVWRTLKASGAAVLRDGVYLLPGEAVHRAAFDAAAGEVRANGGQARVLTGAACEDDLAPLFDRQAEFGAWLVQANEARSVLESGATADAERRARRLRRAFDQLVAIDFHPGEAQRQAASALLSLEAAVAAAREPDEPRPTAAAVPRLDAARYRRRVWATRRRPKVDRLASGWLIRRFIDPEARFKWLAAPADCPKRAVGFDFDGAEFTHVGARVTFETLLAAFDLERPALLRLGAVVHALDAGGVQPPEAPGIERVLAGLHDAIDDDDRLLLAAAGVFEGLHRAFEQEYGR